LNNQALELPLYSPQGLSSARVQVILATLVGLVVRGWVAIGSEVWLDEAYSALLATADLREMFVQLSVDSSPPLYYLILKGWVSLAPFSPLSLRIPSLLFGCALIPALWWVASRLDRPAAGVAGAWLLAVHPLHTLYSEEIRMYALLALLSLFFYYALFEVVRRDGSAVPAWLAATGLAYTHYYGLIFAGAGLLTALFVLPNRRRKVLLCGLGVAVAYLPWLPLFFAQLRMSGTVGWMSVFWDRYPGGLGILRSFQAFLPGGFKYEFVPLEGLPAQRGIVLFGLAPFLALAFKPNRLELSKPLGLPLGVALFTLLIVVVRSYLSEPVYLVGRSDIVVLPLFLLALAMALARLKTRARTLFLLLWVALSGAELLNSAERLKKPGNEALAAALDTAECTTVVASGLSFAPVVFYEMIEEEGAVVVPFPIDMASHPGNMDPSRYSMEALEADAGILAGQYPPGPGVCVLGEGRSFSGPLADAFLAGGTGSRQVGVFQTSLLAGLPYVLVAFTGT
jgi:hypothetical protein